MRDTLFERWFRGGAGFADEEEGPDEEEVALAEERAKWYGFVKADGFRQFERWVQDELDASEVEIDSHESMLTQAGIRIGLKKVAKQLRDMKEFVLIQED